jgi:hypothetical protein
MQIDVDNQTTKALKIAIKYTLNNAPNGGIIEAQLRHALDQIEAWELAQ